MRREELEACRKDPKNRKWGLYYCKADPRVIVPKRHKWMGWTINFAHPGGIPVTLLAVGIVVVPIHFVLASGAGTGALLATVLIITAALCLLCAYFSSTKRWSR